MKYLIIILAFFIISPAVAQDSHAEFFRSDRARSASPAFDGAAASSRKSRGGATSSPVYALAQRAQAYGIPVHIAAATIKLESGGRCNARGRAGELGPLQIKPATARGLGYTGPTSALATCGAGLEWGLRHLALAYRKCGHVGLHNKGLGGSCARSSYTMKVAQLVGRA